MQAISVFAGLSEGDLAWAMDGLELRHFPQGTIVVSEGDSPHELYVVQSGAADVFVSDDRGRQFAVGRVGRGSAVGEMSLFTGQPASATVRAATDLDVVVMSEERFREIAEAFPQVYQNLGKILSQKLVASNRRSMTGLHPKQIALQGYGAPPQLGFALAASVAWHTRRPALLLHVADGEPAPELVRLADESHSGAEPAPGARLRIISCATVDLAGLLHESSLQYDHVFIQLDGEIPPPLHGIIRVSLAGPNEPVPAAPQGGWTVRGWVRPGRAAPQQGVALVPPLTSADEHALCQGLFPDTSAAGRELARVSRDLSGLRVGLALGAGGPKGYAHIGVLRVLAEANVPIDCVAGSSVGACVGALYASGWSLSECLRHLDEVGRRAWRLTVPTNSLISSAGLRAGLQQVFADTRIEDLPLPLAVIAADIISYQEVVFRRGPVWAALLASSSIPGVWPPQRIGDHLLLDGGIVNPVPSDVVAGMGTGLVIAVKLAKQIPSSSLVTEAADARAGGPSAIQAILRAVELMQGSISRTGVETPTIQIDVLFRDVDLPGLRHFPRGRRFVALGEEAARLALPRVVAALPWLRP